MVFIIGSCSIFEGPEEISNPLDPSDPDFVPPAVTFIQSPAEGDTVDTCFVAFEWEGIKPSMNYSYRLDEQEWSDWSSGHSVEHPLLDDGDHRFEVKSQYFNGVERDNPQTINFVVDDILGPALRIYSRLTEVTVGEQFSIEIIAEDVSNMAMAKIVIKFNELFLQVISIQVYEDDTAFLRTNGGTVIPFSQYDNSNGTITINVGVATGSPAGVTGTGAVAKIDFTSTTSGYFSIRFDNSSILRDPDNIPIQLYEFGDGGVYVE